MPIRNNALKKDDLQAYKVPDAIFHLHYGLKKPALWVDKTSIVST